MNRTPVDPEGLAMIRILKDIAADLWGKYNPRRKVIDLDAWRKGK